MAKVTREHILTAHEKGTSDQDIALNDLHRRISEEATGLTGMEVGARLQRIADDVQGLIIRKVV